MISIVAQFSVAAAAKSRIWSLPWCPACKTEGLHAIHRTLAQLHPGLRSSVVCAYSDSVVTALYALLNGGPSQLKAGLLVRSCADSWPSISGALRKMF